MSGRLAAADQAQISPPWAYDLSVDESARAGRIRHQFGDVIGLAQPS
ncbi:MAG TPA: hypothetical protein VHW93_01245 [Acidimicrobiales bacterium]|jgi:hypothetical protein|nr:hypothetical protein [Acidimicrobiales bacterium]